VVGTSETGIPGPLIIDGSLTRSEFVSQLEWEIAIQSEFTVIIERDEEWFIGYCLEIHGASGQGRSIEKCRANLADAIALILEDRREDGL